MTIWISFYIFIIGVYAWCMLEAPKFGSCVFRGVC